MLKSKLESKLASLRALDQAILPIWLSHHTESSFRKKSKFFLRFLVVLLALNVKRYVTCLLVVSFPLSTSSSREMVEALRLDSI